MKPFVFTAILDDEETAQITIIASNKIAAYEVLVITVHMFDCDLPLN